MEECEDSEFGRNLLQLGAHPPGDEVRMEGEEGEGEGRGGGHKGSDGGPGEANTCPHMSVVRLLAQAHTVWLAGGGSSCAWVGGGFAVIRSHPR